MIKKTVLLAFLMGIGIYLNSQTIKATEDIKSPELEIGVVEHLDEYIPEELTVIDTEGNPRKLKSLIDKPTVLMWVYYRCPGICSPLMTSVAEVIGKSDLEIGRAHV